MGTTISLRDYNKQTKGLSYLWICGVGCPAGQDLHHDTEAEGDDYCDLNEILSELGLWRLEGEIVDGRWEWDGDGSPTDERGNAIYNLQAI